MTPRSPTSSVQGALSSNGVVADEVRDLEAVSDLQRELAETLGLDVSSDSFRIAAARLYEAVWPATEIHQSPKAPSDKQLALAEDIDLDVEGNDRAIASQRIAARLRLLNEVALRALDLRPGDLIVLKETPEESHAVSCVGRDRRVFLKRWGGQSVWATQILSKTRVAR